jgi:tetratricopeptide (TPR) repeat protein
MYTMALANSYQDVGRIREALKLHEETLPRCKNKLGADHRETLLSMSNLAFCYAAAGRVPQALKLYEETLQLQEAKLGPHHFDTLLSIYNVACMHARLISKASERDKEADVAMEWLKKAIAAGYKDLGLVKTDTDLDPLRGREDFKKLLAELEAASKKK